MPFVKFVYHNDAAGCRTLQFLDLFAPIADFLGDIREGGARVDLIRYAGAYHQWDGNAGRPDAPVRRASNLAPCRFEVERDATIRDLKSGLQMSNTFFRKLIFAICRDGGGYLQARDDTIRVKSNRDVGRFLAEAFRIGAPPAR